jgi:hypothetical protein
LLKDKNMKTQTKKLFLSLVLLVMGAAALAGCGPGTVAQPQAALPGGEESAAFLDRLSSQKTVSENDAMRGILYLVEGKDTCTTFQERVKHLQDLKIVGTGWALNAEHPVTRGEMAYMVYQALKVKGGVILTLTGPTQWYCAKELKFQGFMTSSIITTEVSGSEYVALIARADGYKATGDVPDTLKTSARGL